MTNLPKKTKVVPKKPKAEKEVVGGLGGDSPAMMKAMVAANPLNKKP